MCYYSINLKPFDPYHLCSSDFDATGLKGFFFGDKYMDKYSKFILTVIAIGLLLNAFEPVNAMAQIDMFSFTGIEAALNAIAHAITVAGM